MLAADHRRRKPRRVTRPEQPKTARSASPDGGVDMAPAVAAVKSAAAALAARNAARNATVLSPGG